MAVRIIAVPYHAGDDIHPSARGPSDLVENGAVAAIAPSRGVVVERIDRAAPFRDTASSSASVNRRLAASIRSAVSEGTFPLVLAGSCTAAHGVMAGIGRTTTGIVWIDAHADLNTPESTVSGFFPGMSLAVLMGHCYADYYVQLGGVPVGEAAVALLGVRHLSAPAERERLQRSGIRFLEWADGLPRGDVLGVLDAVADGVEDVYLHIDMDAFAPEIAPGVADEPVPGGLSFDDAERIIDAVAARVPIAAATLATFSPDRDSDGRTRSLALEVIRAIGRRATPS